jgi:hypothetical protein
MERNAGIPVGTTQLRHKQRHKTRCPRCAALAHLPELLEVVLTYGV